MKKLLVLVCLFLFSLSVTAQKMKAEVVVAKNLDSIGTSESRLKIKNTAIIGTVNFSQGSGQNVPSIGEFAFASEGSKRLFGMAFNVEIYPFEKISYDEKKVKVAFGRPGIRSALGEYLSRYPEIIKEGLLSGVLSNNWALAVLTTNKGKIEFKDGKKVNGKEAYMLDYSPKKGSGVAIKLYFDATTFQHLRTEYQSTLSAQMGSNPNLSASQIETREVLTEDFADFKNENGLMLPHSYKISLAISGKTSREYNYDLKLTDFYINQQLDANTFDIEAK
jgi:hypothetical protein